MGTDVGMGNGMGITVDDRGRVTLPQELRDALGLVPGQEVHVERTERGLLLRKATTVEEFIERLEGCVDGAKTRPRLDPLRVKEMWGPFHDHD
jgi:AbrB family looped-hinge helix DNA binding protein